MSNIAEFENLYDNIVMRLEPSDALQLMVEAKTEDQRNFYRIVGNYLIQRKQREVVERGLF